MSRGNRKKQKRLSYCPDEEMEMARGNQNDDWKDAISKLADGMAEMQFSISQLADCMKNNIKQGEQIQKSNLEHENRDSVNKADSIRLWRDLGGSNIYFSQGGSVHHMIFIKKLRKLFVDAGVPEESRLSLAANTLRGSAADWFVAKEGLFQNFDHFCELFKRRYWGLEQERELFFEMKYGKFKSGCLADYFVKMASQAAHLSEKIDEGKLVEWLMGHFSEEIQRGMLIAGLKDIEEVEKYLRKLDGVKNTESRSENVNRNENGRNVGGSSTNYYQRGRQDGQVRNSREGSRTENANNNNSKGFNEVSYQKRNDQTPTNTTNAEINRSIRYLDLEENLLSDEENKILTIVYCHR